MPDIDMDFCGARRQEVIDYVVRKYGADHVAQIITFGTMAARAAVRDVGRALDMSYAEVDAVAKMVPRELKITLDKALAVSKDLRNLYEQDERVHLLLDTARPAGRDAAQRLHPCGRRGHHRGPGIQLCALGQKRSRAW